MHPILKYQNYKTNVNRSKERETESNTIIVEDFYTPLSEMGRSFRQDEIAELKYTLYQLDLIDIYSTFYLISTE